MIKKEMRFIPQMEPWFGNEEAAALNEYMLGDGWVTEFKKTEEFENRIADFVGVKHCVAVNNGTVSLTLAAIASGIGSGDEVIIPNYTMVASPNSVKMIGANPIFVDIELDSLCLDIELTRDAITPKTKAKLAILEPITFPILIRLSSPPFKAAPILTNSSGADVPKETTVIPITKLEI